MGLRIRSVYCHIVPILARLLGYFWCVLVYNRVALHLMRAAQGVTCCGVMLTIGLGSFCMLQ